MISDKSLSSIVPTPPPPQNDIGTFHLALLVRFPGKDSNPFIDHLSHYIGQVDVILTMRKEKKVSANRMKRAANRRLRRRCRFSLYITRCECQFFTSFKAVHPAACSNAQLPH